MHLGGNDKGELLPWSQPMTHPADKPLNDKYKGKCFFINLGPTGIRVLIDRKAPTQLLVKYVFQDSFSPARGIVEIGDVIVGANGKMFKTPTVFHRKQGPRGVHGPARDMAQAIEYSQGKDGQLDLIILRGGVLQKKGHTETVQGGKRKIVTVQLKPVGEFSPTWPWNCPRSDKLRKKLCDFMFANNAGSGRMWRRIQTTLALWASGDPRGIALAKRLGQQLTGTRVDPEAGGMCTWTWGYIGIFLGEYYNAYKDKAVIPAAESLAVGYETSQDWSVGACSHRPFPAIWRRVAGGGPKGYGAMAGTGGLAMIAQSIFKLHGLPYSPLAYSRTHQAYLMTAGGGNASGSIAYGFRGWGNGWGKLHIRLKDAARSPCKAPKGIGFLCPTGMKNIGEFDVEKWTAIDKARGKWKMELVSSAGYPWLRTEADTLRVYQQGKNRRMVIRPQPNAAEPTGPYQNNRQGGGHISPVGMGAVAHYIGNKGNKPWNYLGKHMGTCCASSGRTLWDGHACAEMHAFFGTLGAFRADDQDLRNFLNETKLWLILSEPHDGQGLVEQPFGAQRNGTCSLSRDRKSYTHIAILCLSMPQRRLLVTGADSTADGSGVNPLYDIQADGFTITHCQKEAKYLESGPFSTVLKALDRAAEKDDKRATEAGVFAERLRQWISKYTEALIEKSRTRPAKSLMEFDDYLKRVRGLDEAEAIEARKKELKGIDGINALVAAYKNHAKIDEHERMHGSSRQVESKKKSVVKKLEGIIADEDAAEALRKEAELLLAKVKKGGAPSGGDSSPGITIEGPTGGSHSGGTTSTAGPATPAGPRSAPRARKADAETIARHDAKLVARIKAAIDGGDRPQFLLKALNSLVRIVAVEGENLLVVETIDPPMQFRMEWSKLTLDAKKGIAVGLAREGNEEDHALAAFYAFASGDKKTAETHLEKAGQAGDKVRAVFE